MADEVGRVLVISFASNLPSLDAIKRIHEDGELPQPIATTERLESYPWKIKNKYFTVDVHLCHARSTNMISLLIEETSHICFEGIIIIFDQEKKETLKYATDCMKLLESHNASVHLLLNAGKDDTTLCTQGLSKTEVLEWCLKYSFELVELNPNDDDQQDAGEFGEHTGFPRVIQALNCGEWPNIELKGSKKDSKVSETSTTDDAKSCAQSQTNEQNSSECKTDEEKSTRLMDCSGLTDDESELLRRIGQEDHEGESFEELFTKLRDMKDHAATLPDEERKSYAEQVAVAFWKAMGGDDDEILE